MALQANAIQKGWSLASLKKSQILKAAHAIRAQAAKIYKCKVTEILLSVCLEMARKGEKLAKLVAVAVDAAKLAWDDKVDAGMICIISGDTYRNKTWIKGYGGLRYNGDTKTWSGKLYYNAYIWATKQLGLTVTPVIAGASLPVVKSQSAATWDGWCNKCQSYCWGDCEASQN